MALEVLETISETRGCRDIHFWDITGTYDASTNPTGYGDASTVVTSTVDGAIITLYPEGYESPIVFTFVIANLVITSATVTAVDGTVTALTLVNTAFPFTEALPFIINGSDLGNGDDSELTLGAYKLEYEVLVAAAVVGNSSSDYLIACQVERAVKNAQGALDTPTCDCNDGEVIAAFKSRVLLDSAKYSMENGEPVKAGETLAYAFALANGECKTC